MGADGGSIPDRRDLVKTRGKAEKTDKAVARERFFYCALSKKPLVKPVAADPLGKLYNKEAVIEYLIDKSAYGDGEEICPYINGVKDLLTLNVMPNPSAEEGKAPFVCWLSLKEMNGAVPFIALRHCGCVFSDSALRALVPNLARQASMDKDKDDKETANSKTDSSTPEDASCPNCTKAFDPASPTATLPIYPPPDVQDYLLNELFAMRALAKANKKRKKEGKEDKPNKAAKAEKAEKKEKERVDGDKSRSTSGSPAPRTGSKPAVSGSLARSVHEKLAEQEKKRLAAQAGMSDAVKSMFVKSEPGKKSDVADFFGRTFNRYATN